MIRWLWSWLRAPDALPPAKNVIPLAYGALLQRLESVERTVETLAARLDRRPAPRQTRKRRRR